MPTHTLNDTQRNALADLVAYTYPDEEKNAVDNNMEGGTSLMSSVYLEAVAQAREHRQDAETEFRAALVRARKHHSLREIAPYAGLTYSGVAWLTDQKQDDDERA